MNSIIHLASFLQGEKSACRLVVPTDVATSVGMLAAADGLFFLAVPIANTAVGADWSDFQLTSGRTDVAMAVLAESLQAAQDVVDAEATGNFRIAGELLGYPPCCINAYAEVTTQSDYWPRFYLKQGLNASCMCNRFALLRGASCPTGYLFPCSLTCPLAIEQGKGNLRALSKFGLDKLSSNILEQARMPLCVLEGKVFAKNNDLSAGHQSVDINIR